MRQVWMIAVAAVFAGGAAMAQTTGTTHRAPRPATTATGEKPLDNGPFTPEASRAYQGGGVILQGQPGGPAPTPEATPPGQTPRNAVPP